MAEAYAAQERARRAGVPPFGEQAWRRAQVHVEPPARKAERTPYEVLGVAPQASLQEIRVAYRRAVQQYHPDQVAHLAPELRDLAEERTKEINAAYNLLKRGRT